MFVGEYDEASLFTPMLELDDTVFTTADGTPVVERGAGASANTYELIVFVTQVLCSFFLSSSNHANNTNRVAMCVNWLDHKGA